jgi:hypothetical protein
MSEITAQIIEDEDILTSQLLRLLLHNFFLLLFLVKFAPSYLFFSLRLLCGLFCL